MQSKKELLEELTGFKAREAALKAMVQTDEVGRELEWLTLVMYECEDEIASLGRTDDGDEYDPDRDYQYHFM